jgi:GT2 family glycosyltransferase
MSPARVTIVVVTWNRREETLACLASLARAELGGARIVVVDNGSRDGTAEAIRAGFPDVQVVALPENRGYAGGCNAGIRAALEAGAAGVVLLNNDTEVAADFLGPLVEAIDTDPTFAGVSSAVLRFDRPELLDVAYSEVQFGRRHVVQLLGVNALVGQGFDRRRQIPVATGCSVLLRAEALRAVGLFDEAYFAYHEDVDWCLRAAQRGWHFLYEPYSRVYHHRSRSTARPRPARIVRARAEPALPEAEPMSWNPVRAYLGARNVVRLQRAHTGKRNRARFLAACLRELPLELAAVVFDREGWLRLGRWGWTDAWRDATSGRHPAVASLPGGPLVHGLARASLLPYDLLVATPRDVWRAWRGGQLAELGATLRGLWDGYLGRRLPLERLGLR